MCEALISAFCDFSGLCTATFQDSHEDDLELITLAAVRMGRSVMPAGRRVNSATSLQSENVRDMLARSTVSMSRCTSVLMQQDAMLHRVKPELCRLQGLRANRMQIQHTGCHSAS